MINKILATLGITAGIIMLGIGLYAGNAFSQTTKLDFLPVQQTVSLGCMPEADARSMVVQNLPNALELNAAQRKEFNDVVNAAPPPTDYPVPPTIIIGERNGTSFLVHTHFVDPTQLCMIAAQQGSFFHNLIGRFLGRGA